MRQFVPLWAAMNATAVVEDGKLVEICISANQFEVADLGLDDGVPGVPEELVTLVYMALRNDKLPPLKVETDEL